ncbi:MAG: ribosome-associated translation inhibitor RaiA [Gemmatimonadota bacterium]
MQITFSARHCTVSESTREHAARRVGRLRRIEQRPAEVALNFQEDHGQKSAEVLLHIAGGGAHMAKAKAPTFRTAVDRAVERLERQVKRDRARARARRAAASPA